MQRLVLIATVAVCAFAVVDAAVKAGSPQVCGGYGLSCPHGWECCGDPASAASACFNPRDSQCCGAATSDFVCPASRECCVSGDGQRKACCAPGNCTGDGTCGTPSPPTSPPTLPPVPPSPAPTCFEPMKPCGDRCIPGDAPCCDSSAVPGAYCNPGDICCVYGTGNVSCCPNTRQCNSVNGQCDLPTTPAPAPTPVPCTMCNGQCVPPGASCCGLGYCAQGTSCCYYNDNQGECCSNPGPDGCQYLTGQCEGGTGAPILPPLPERG